MKAERLFFEGFRNLETDEIRPDGGINVIYGENAQGKTNLLEALWLFSGARSFRDNDKKRPQRCFKRRKAEIARRAGG